MDETVPDDIAAVTQQDIIYLAEFLNNFDLHTDEDPVVEPATTTTPTDTTANSDGTQFKTPTTTPQQKRFNLERVGQYLEDKNLQIQSTIDLTQKWNQLLDENECLKKCDIIYPHQKHLSLVQQHNLLKTSISELFSRPEKLIQKHFTCKSAIECAQLNENSTIKTSHICMDSSEKNGTVFAGLISRKFLFILEMYSESNEKRAIKLEFQQKPFYEEKFCSFGDLEFRDIQFYNEEHLSILLYSVANKRATNCIVQFPWMIVQSRMSILPADTMTLDISHMLPIINFYELLDPTLIRVVDGVDGDTISVSGSRKVASLLSQSQKRIRIYEMEVEEDDDLDMSQNNSLDISKESIQSI